MPVNLPEFTVFVNLQEVSNDILKQKFTTFVLNTNYILHPKRLFITKQLLRWETTDEDENFHIGPNAHHMCFQRLL